MCSLPRAGTDVHGDDQSSFIVQFGLFFGSFFLVACLIGIYCVLQQLAHSQYWRSDRPLSRQRVVAQRIIDAAAEQEAVLLDMSDDELDSDDEEYLADLQREIAELIVALTWVEPQDTKAGQRVSDLDKWSVDSGIARNPRDIH